MALCAKAGYSIQTQPEGCDVVVVNTCGFLASACEEAIENILEMAELKKKESKSTDRDGCMAERYKDEILEEIPEVDEVLGTTAYDKILDAVDAALEGNQEVILRILMHCHCRRQSVLLQPEDILPI